jgi:type II secretory pathway pseudopilin PulG
MRLRGQPEKGYAMAVLLVALSVMAVMLTVAMPVWNHAARREKEAELLFRGQQYARAIGLFQRKYAGTPPPDLDVLVRERFLRKKYKDPITNGDFVPIPAAQAAQGARTPQNPPPGQPISVTLSQPLTPTGGRGGGIIGVTSASKDASIRIYNGAAHYDEWRFVFVQTTTTPGAAPGGGTATPGRGQPGGGAATPGRGQPGGQRGAPIGPGLGIPGGPGRGGRGQ